MRLLFVRPPKYLWPYINEQDNYLLSQAMACLGAEARRRGHEARLLDCMPLKMGWRGLEQEIRDYRPQVVLAGDSETLYAHESGRVFSLAKSISLEIFTIAGGVHFTHACEDAFGKYPIDAIVRGEGEETLGDLLDAIERGSDISNVAGLALRDGASGIRYTSHRPLIEDLDSLAFPAYDLLPMERYGAARYLFSPGGTTIHHSRGCTDSCSYCACWLQMSRRHGDAVNETLSPRWRTRSVSSVIHEVEVLAGRYNKKCLIFVDDTWNADPKWSDDFATELLRRRLRIVWFAFMRADMLARDEESGLFEKLVASGLQHICVGLERADGGEIEQLNKHNIDIDSVNRVVPLLRRKHPSLFLQTTFIVGLRHDSNESLDRLLGYVEGLNPDYPAFHPITPVPGTALWKEARDEGRLEITDFSKYDWMTPVMSTEHLSRDELELKIWLMNRRYLNPLRIARGILSSHRYRRRMYVWWLLVSLAVGRDYILDRLLPWRSMRRKAALSEYVGMVRPDWYDE